MDVVCGAHSALTTGSFEFGGALGGALELVLELVFGAHSRELESGGVPLSWFWSSCLELTAGSFEFGGTRLRWFWSSSVEVTARSFEFGGLP